METIAVADQRIELSGESGPKVVLIPSLGRGRRDFDALVRRLVDAGYRPVALDLPGVGGRADLEEGATLHDLADDVAGVIDTVGAPAHVVGHAFGSRIARCLAVDHPASVVSLTLLSSGGLIDPGAEVNEARRTAMLSEDRAERLAALREIFFAPTSDATVWLDGWWPTAIRAHSKANQRTPHHEWWHGGDRPIHIIQGVEDRDAVPENARLMHRLLGDRVEVTEIADAGHALLPEQPAHVAEALMGFLSRCVADAS